MPALKKLKGRFLFEEEAQGMTEYILLIFLIVLACVFALKMYGGKIRKGYNVGAETLRNIAR